MIATLVVSVVASVSAETSSAAAPRARFAIVVGVNQPLPGSGYDQLRYADDDALRFAELFDELGVDTTVLTAADEDTATRYPDQTRRAVRPTVASLDATFAAVEQKLHALEGKPRELYFVFSGHGSISSSSAYLHLFDGTLTRTDLYEKLLKRMPAERIHVIIDSCHSYFLVNARGRRVATATDEENLDRYPAAGFVLSTSDSREVQEWSGYRAGVFSYQVLGAMRGAADVDLDGVVTYDEVHAYVVAANLKVEREDARIRPHLRRPNTPDRDLTDLRRANPKSKLTLPPQLSGHFYLEDERGVRVLDAHKASGTSLAVTLPVRRRLYLRSADLTYEVRTSTVTKAATLVAIQPSEELALASNKGTVADDFRMNLFKVPLTTDFVRGLAAGTPQVTHVHRIETLAWHDDPVTISLLGVGTVGVLTGVFATAFFVDARDDANQSPVSAETERARGRAQDWQAVMIGSYAAGGAILAAGVLRAFISNAGPEEFGLGPGPRRTAGLSIRGAF